VSVPSSAGGEVYFTTCWRWNRHSVPKRRLIMFGRRGNTQKTIFHELKLFNGNWKRTRNYISL